MYSSAISFSGHSMHNLFFHVLFQRHVSIDYMLNFRRFDHNYFSGNLIKYCSKFKTYFKIMYGLPRDDASILLIQI